MEERRYYGFDALRGGMMLLGLLLHAATFYLAAPSPAMPGITDRHTWYGLDLLFHWIHSFRMPVFFVMAGFFASLLVAKRGLVGMLRNRAARILAPFLAGLLVILPPTLLLVVSFMVSVRFGTHDLIPDLAAARAVGLEAIAKHPEANQPSPLHLWFLYYLCYFYLAVPVLEWLARRLAPHATGWGDKAGSPSVFLLLVAATAMALWPYRGAQLHEGFLYFAPHLPSLIYFGGFFTIGYLLNACGLIGSLRLRQPQHYVVLGAALYPLAVLASHLEYSDPGADGRHLLACVANALCTWAWVYAFISLALRVFDRPSSWALYVSQSSYWVFLAHMPFAAFAVWALASTELFALGKFLLVLGFCTTTSFLTYHYWVQGSWIGVFLNGRRFDMDWPWRARAHAQPAPAPLAPP